MILVRICLIVAIIAGLAAAAVSHFQVDVKIKDLNTNLAETKSSLDKSQLAEKKAKSEQKATEAKLKKSEQDLANTTKNLEEAQTEEKAQRARADRHQAELTKMTEERNDAQRELARWNAYNIRVDEVSNLVVTVRNTKAEIEAVKAENKVLSRNNAQIQARLDQLIEPDKKVVMRDGLKGKVIAVDPKWDFVVLDIGSEQGAVERGEMLVDRKGKLVAKVKLSSVEANRSVANILPEFRQANVMEGDQVIY